MAAARSIAACEPGEVINEHYTFDEYVRRRAWYLTRHAWHSHQSTRMFPIARSDANLVFASEDEELSAQEVRRRERAQGVDPLLPLSTTGNTQTIDDYRSYPTREWVPGMTFSSPHAVGDLDSEDDDRCERSSRSRAAASSLSRAFSPYRMSSNSLWPDSGERAVPSPERSLTSRVQTNHAARPQAPVSTEAYIHQTSHLPQSRTEAPGLSTRQSAYVPKHTKMSVQTLANPVTPRSFRSGSVTPSSHRGTFSSGISDASPAWAQTPAEPFTRGTANDFDRSAAHRTSSEDTNTLALRPHPHVSSFSDHAGGSLVKPQRGTKRKTVQSSGDSFGEGEEPIKQRRVAMNPDSYERVTTPESVVSSIEKPERRTRPTLTDDPGALHRMDSHQRSGTSERQAPTAVLGRKTKLPLRTAPKATSKNSNIAPAPPARSQSRLNAREASGGASGLLMPTQPGLLTRQEPLVTRPTGTPRQIQSPDNEGLEAVIMGTALPRTATEAKRASTERRKRLLALQSVHRPLSGTHPSSRSQADTDEDTLMPEFFDVARFTPGMEDQTVRCVCGATDDDGAEMIACDGCMVWQHNACMGPAVPTDLANGTYACQMCDPWAHRVVLARLRRETAYTE